MYRAPPPPRHVYVVEAENGLFKLGSSRFPEKRADAICAHSPCRVRLVAIWPGRVIDEQALHARLEPFRSHHEWFEKMGDAEVFFSAVFGRGLAAVKDWSECDRPTMFGRRKALSDAAKKKWADPAYRAARSKPIQRPAPSLAEAS